MVTDEDRECIGLAGRGARHGVEAIPGSNFSTICDALARKERVTNAGLKAGRTVREHCCGDAARDSPAARARGGLQQCLEFTKHPVVLAEGHVEAHFGR